MKINPTNQNIANNYAPQEINYEASAILSDFHASEKFVRAIIGPIGSGKSVACCIELLLKSFAQRPNSQGIRKTRWAIIRNTYRELIDTTMQTFFDWFPQSLGVFRKIDMKFTVDLPLPDDTIAHIEFLFRALDKPDDIKKLLSLELTGGWINEVREIPRSIFDMLIGRVGRYPNMRDGGPTWHGLILDTNPPDSDHWFYKLFEKNLPTNHAIFHQPSGMSPEAENIKNLPKLYYENIMQGKDQEWINVYIHGQYGFVQDGKPIFPEYVNSVHSTNEEIALYPNYPIYVGIDFGLTPAAVFGQLSPNHRWLIFDEFVTEDMGTKNFASLLNEYINRHYSDYHFEFTGDPAGEQRAQTDEITPFQILMANGIPAVPANTNDFTLRREAVAAPLTRLDATGKPGFLIGPKCEVLKKALAGGYKYKRMNVTGQERFNDRPDKNMYSHPAEALQYMMLGAGEGNKVITTSNSNDPIDYSKSDKAIL